VWAIARLAGGELYITVKKKRTELFIENNGQKPIPKKHQKITTACYEYRDAMKMDGWMDGRKGQQQEFHCFFSDKDYTRFSALRFFPGA